MTRSTSRCLSISFYLLFFLVPLVLYHKTSELFEFNKMIVTYIFTTIITSLWVTRMVSEKKVIFKRSFLDIPLILFLCGQLFSTVVSIDPRTSFFGYYTRFHGGLLSSISYSLLYWALVSNLKRREAVNSLISTLISAFLVCTYAVLEHFGVDKDIWIQDVQTRVFSTLGQPNWLAAWIVPIIPISWAFSLAKKRPKLRSIDIPSWVWVGFSILFFLTLVYTKSRSGFLGFAVLEAMFWPALLIISLKHRDRFKQILIKFVVIHILIAVIISITGTPWTQGAGRFFTKTSEATTIIEKQKPVQPALEAERYDSGRIRRIVWQGAIDVWKHYPIAGSGVETFAYSYYQFRPVEHNLVSEWDFLYNKAHNEYLNFLATTGVVGTGTYLVLVIYILFLFIKVSGIIPAVKHLSKKSSKIMAPGLNNILPVAFLSGFFSILVTNFFGFSVVPVAVLFFLLPALSVSYDEKDTADGTKSKDEKVNSGQKVIIASIAFVAVYSLFSIGKYWYTDYIYAQGKAYADIGDYLKSRELFGQAVKLSPNEAIFWDELAQTNSRIAVALSEDSNEELAIQLANEATKQSERAVNLSPANINLKRTQASIFINIAIVNPNYLLRAQSSLEQAIEKAPTEAKLLYNLGLTYAKIGDTKKAKEILHKTLEMKPNYRNPYFALGIIYAEEGETELAREQFEYILENISPEDSEVQRQLNELNN